jgi:hypothetical protein
LLEASRVLQRAKHGRAAVLGAIGFQPFEDFLRVVQDSGGRIHRDRRARLDACVVPAFRLVIADGHHVVGEHAAEARILQKLGALVGRDRRRVRMVNELKLGLGHFSLGCLSQL